MIQIQQVQNDFVITVQVRVSTSNFMSRSPIDHIMDSFNIPNPIVSSTSISSTEPRNFMNLTKQEYDIARSKVFAE